MNEAEFIAKIRGDGTGSKSVTIPKHTAVVLDLKLGELVKVRIQVIDK